MLQNGRVTTFTVSECLRENQQEGGGKITPSPPLACPPTHLHTHIWNNTFLVNILILYPLKTQETRRFYGVSCGYKMRALPRNVLKWAYAILLGAQTSPNNNQAVDTSTLFRILLKKLYHFCQKLHYTCLAGASGAMNTMYMFTVDNENSRRLSQW